MNGPVEEDSIKNSNDSTGKIHPNTNEKMVKFTPLNRFRTPMKLLKMYDSKDFKKVCTHKIVFLMKFFLILYFMPMYDDTGN